MLTITRLDGMIYLSPIEPFLIKYLKYSERTMELRNYRKEVVFKEKLLYRLDDKGLYTLPGFFDKLVELAHKNHCQVSVIDRRSPMPVPNWELVRTIGLRSHQVEHVANFISKGMQSSGLAEATGGWGKTHLQMVTYAAWDSLNTILCIPLKQVAIQTYKKFQETFKNKHIGRIGAGYNDISTDITISTFASLENAALEKCEMLLVDEMQSASSNSFQNALSQMRPKRIFGYSATPEGMFNNSGKLLKGIFGERLIYVDYEQAEDVGAVVPGFVYVLRVPNLSVSSYNSFDKKLEHLVKKYTPRNQLIGRVAALVPQEWQAIWFVDHLDHLVEVYKNMPVGTRYVHRQSSKKAVGSFAMTAKQQTETIDAFGRGEFNHLICTDAMRAGADIPNVRVVVQTASGSSEVEVLQEAYRGSRTLPEASQKKLGVSPKTHFVLIDFLDDHDPQLQAMAQKRIAYYEKQGWQVSMVDTPDQIDWNPVKKVKTL